MIRFFLNQQTANFKMKSKEKFDESIDDVIKIRKIMFLFNLFFV